MRDFDSGNRMKGKKRHLELAEDNLAPDKDLIMEQILENLNATPLGQVLQKIASLPEVRQEKVLSVRQQLTEGKYELNEHLDLALERVLEDLST